MRVLRLGAASLPVVAAFTAVGVASRVGPATGGCVQASSVHHATLVVEHANGAPVTRVCVSFAGGSVTGEQLLNLSGVPYNTVDNGSYGKAVCQIQSEPTSYPASCWTAASPYWALFVSRGGGAWTWSGRGLSTQTFNDGDAEGFRYEGQSDNSVPASPAGLCPRPVPATPVPVTTSAPTRGSPIAVARSSATSASVATTAATATPTAALDAPNSVSQGGGTTPAVVAQVKAGGPPPASPGPATAGVWIAAALGASLLALLAAQLARQRRTRPGR